MKPALCRPETTVALFLSVVFAVAVAERDVPGAGILVIWPSARSAGLAGAATALADEPDATFFNPAGLAFQSGPGLGLSCNQWLPGFAPDMNYAAGFFSTPGPDALGPFSPTQFGASLYYHKVDEVGFINEHGEFLGMRSAWRGAAAFSAAGRLSDRLALGVSLKLFHSRHTCTVLHMFEPWFWGPGFPELGFEYGGDATAIGADLGLRWIPVPRLSVGACLANRGPDIHYCVSDWGLYTEPEYRRYTAPLPALVRLGGCWTAVETPRFRLLVLPELTKLLPGTGQAPDYGHTWDLRDEFADIWKSLGLELSAFDLVHLRLGYFEDLARYRGGVVVRRAPDDWPYRVSLWEYLTRRGLVFERLDLCWGIGLGYRDIIRLDIANDGAAYDTWSEWYRSASNWRVSLVTRDLAGLMDCLRGGGSWTGRSNAAAAGGAAAPPLPNGD